MLQGLRALEAEYRLMRRKDYILKPRATPSLNFV